MAVFLPYDWPLAPYDHSKGEWRCGKYGARLAQVRHSQRTHVAARGVSIPPLARLPDEMWFWDKPRTRPDSLGERRLLDGHDGGVRAKRMSSAGEAAAAAGADDDSEY